MDVVATIAAIATAAGTLGLAIFTFIVIRENKKLINAAVQEAQATAEQARASVQQAEAAVRMLREVQVDRELGNAPYLTFRFVSGFQGAGEPVGSKVDIENIGRGPALNCLYCARAVWQDNQAVIEGAVPGGMHPLVTRDYRYPAARRAVPLLHLGSGKASGGSLDEAQMESPAGHVLAQLLWTEGVHEGAVCEDQFGTRYFFRQGQARPETWHPRSGSLQPGWSMWIPLPVESAGADHQPDAPT